VGLAPESDQIKVTLENASALASRLAAAEVIATLAAGLDIKVHFGEEASDLSKKLPKEVLDTLLKYQHPFRSCWRLLRKMASLVRHNAK
jgi:hypothetical protein